MQVRLKYYQLLCSLLITTVAHAQLAQPPVVPFLAVPSDPIAGHMRVLASNPHDLGALVGAGQAALSGGDAAAALNFFGRANAQDPNDGRVKAGLGSTLLLLERPEDALRLFGQAVALGVPERMIAVDRGLAYDLRGDQASAQRDYLQALQSDKSDELVRRYALSLGISGQKNQALTVLDPLLRREDQAAWRDRSFIMAMNGDQRGARDIIRAVLPQQADSMIPFFKRLPGLSSAERARAVTYGLMPGDAAPDVIVPPSVVAPVTFAANKPAQLALIRPAVKSPPTIFGLPAKAFTAPPSAPIQRTFGGTVSAPSSTIVRHDSPPLDPPAVYEVSPKATPIVLVPTVVPPKRVVMPPPISVPPLQIAPPPPPIQTAPLGQDAAMPKQLPVAPDVPQVTPSDASLIPKRTLSLTPASPTISSAPPRSIMPDAVTAQPKFNLASIVDDVAPIAAPTPVTHILSDKELRTTRLVTKRKAEEKARADAVIKAKADAEAAAAAEQLAIEKRNPAREWVQIAQGNNQRGFSRTWDILQANHIALLKDRHGYVTPINRSFRILVGPFKSLHEARSFLTKITSDGLSGLIFTSEAGQIVEKIGGA